MSRIIVSLLFGTGIVEALAAVLALFRPARLTSLAGLEPGTDWPRLLGEEAGWRYAFLATISLGFAGLISAVRTNSNRLSL